MQTTTTFPLTIASLMMYLEHGKRVGTRRMWQLYCLACCKMSTVFMTPEGLEALALAEEVIEEKKTIGQWQACQTRLAQITNQLIPESPFKSSKTWSANYDAVIFLHRAIRKDLWLDDRFSDRNWHCSVPQQVVLLREIVPPPEFREDSSIPRTRNVLSIAQNAYNTRDYRILPILADALEDEFYDNQVLLEHLRSPSGHMFGCWALEKVLGKW